jgi:vacuolar-type H+-ATPase subunit E/Vma4
MPENNQKLDRFTAAILSEALAESEQAIAAFQEKRRKKIEEATKQVNAEMRIYEHDEITRIQTKAGQQISRRMHESRRTLYQRRNQIADEVFENVRQKIEAYTSTPEYGRRLGALLSQALGVLADARDVRVYLRAEDQWLIPELRNAAPEVTFAEGEFCLGGLIAESTALGLRVDSSFDSRLTELNGHFAELFGISLSDAE